MKRGAAQRGLGVVLLLTFLLVGCGDGGGGNNLNNPNGGSSGAGTNSPGAATNPGSGSGSNAPQPVAKTCADYSKPASANISQAQLYATLFQFADSSFYGVTELGGASGKGTVYRISASSVHTLLHSFNGDDGLYPSGGLAKGADGSFYGTVSAGGRSGHGVIFKITPAGAYTVLYSFNNTTPALGCNCGIGRPRGDLLLAEDGFFYGVADLGASRSGIDESGAVFRVSATGHFSPVVYFPTGGARNASNGLIQGSDGHLYGKSYQGGIQNQGLIYRVLLP